MTIQADARPTKAFFIKNLTRDLSLEDAILDLVDNSVDGLIRSRNILVDSSLLNPPDNGHRAEVTGRVEIEFNEQRFSINDRCGGIGLDRARQHAFRLGNAEPETSGTFGVYGIGMKRALFKLGNKVRIESKTLEDGFTVALDVAEWAESDDLWTIPLEEVPAAKSKATAGTKITVTELSPEIQQRIRDPRMAQLLTTTIARTYALFLDRFVVVSLNGNVVRPQPVPIAMSADLEAASQTFNSDGVTVDIIAGLAPREDGEWASEQAGWYVLCNGRIVISADKTPLTGWGGGRAQFVSKYRGFVGLAFFFARNAANLPWTTTKRDLNEESAVYQRARNEMIRIAKPVLSFLNSLYPSDPTESVEARQLASELKPTTVGGVLALRKDTFTAPAKRLPKVVTIRVQYDALRSDIDRVRKALGKPSNWPAGQAGLAALEYFLEHESQS